MQDKYHMTSSELNKILLEYMDTSEMKVVSVAIPKYMIDIIKKLQNARIITSRSEYLRASLKRAIESDVSFLLSTSAFKQKDLNLNHQFQLITDEFSEFLMGKFATLDYFTVKGQAHEFLQMKDVARAHRSRYAQFICIHMGALIPLLIEQNIIKKADNSSKNNIFYQVVK